jgi:hypothetical protein
MAALQTLAVPVVLSARLRLALHPHAASGCLLALDKKFKNPAGLALCGVFVCPGADSQRLSCAAWVTSPPTGERKHGETD